MKKKNIIISSIITIALCMSMIVGSTFALFTSESKVNIAVTSGKVSVIANVDETSVQTKQLYDIEYEDGKDNMYKGEATFSAEGLTLDKFVPGDGLKFNIIVKNESDVMVKYRTIISCENDNGLFAGLDINIGENENYSGETLVSDWAELAVGSENAIVPVTIELPEGAGNEYQDKTCTVSYNVEAVQGNVRVANPEKVSSSTTFAEFAALIADGKDIYLDGQVTIANPESSRYTEFEINSNVSIYAGENATLTFAETTGLTGDGTLTIYGGCIDEKQELWVGGKATLVFEAGEHSFAAFSASSNGKIVVNGGTLNCLGTYAGIMGITFGENGSLIVNDGTLNMYQPFNLNPNRCDNAYIEINGGTIDLLNGIENLFVVRNIMEKDNESGVLRGSSIRVNGGTFIAHYEIDSAGDATSFIRNGDATADGNKVLVSNTDGYDCVVKGGTFYGSWQRADNQRYTDGNGGYSDGLLVENSIAGFVADDYQITGDATSGYIVSAK